MAKKTKAKDYEKEIEKATKELLEKLMVEAKVTVAKDPEDHFKVNIETSETGLLIGFHGATLNSLQLLLGVILYKKMGEWVRVVVDVGDYRKTREENIKEMAERIVKEVEVNNQPVVMPYLTPFERRVVHLLLSSHPKVTSESEGEGRERRVVIKPRPTS